MRVCAATLVLSLCCAGGCKKNTDPTTVDYWAERANSRQTRDEALKELGKLGNKDALPVLVKWFEQPGSWQTEAAYSLGQLQDANAVAPLIAHLDYNVAASSGDKLYTTLSIVRALAMLRSPQAVAPLTKLLSNPEPKVREVVIPALAQLQAKAAVPQLLAVAQDPNAQPMVIQAALRALGNLNAAQGVDLLVRALYDDAFYEDARDALLQVGSAAEASLVQTLERRNARVEAMRTEDDKPLPDGSIETRAATVLGAMRADKAVLPMAAALDKLYKRYLAKPKEAPPSVFSGIVELAYAMGSVGGPQAVKALLPLLKAPQDTLRMAASEALTTAGPDVEASKALLAAAGVGSADARNALIEALTRVGTADVLPAVDALPKKADKDVPAAALTEMVESSRERLVAAGECKDAPACWRSKLRAPNAVVRERAAYEMGWLRMTDSAPDLLKLAEDEVPMVRMAAVLSLQRLGGSDALQLQKIYDVWASKVQYAAVNQELKALIARSKAPKS